MNKILTLAFPLIISQLISMALVLTDVWMMSRISVSALAAGGLGASIYFFIFIIASSTVGCVANLIAIAYGQRVARPEFGNTQIRLAVKGAVMLAFVLSVSLMASFWFAPLVLEAAKQPPEVITLAMEYVHALKWVMLPSLILLVLRGLTSAFGNVRSILVMSDDHRNSERACELLPHVPTRYGFNWIRTRYGYCGIYRDDWIHGLGVQT